MITPTGPVLKYEVKRRVHFLLEERAQDSQVAVQDAIPTAVLFQSTGGGTPRPKNNWRVDNKETLGDFIGGENPERCLV